MSFDFRNAVRIATNGMFDAGRQVPEGVTKDMVMDIMSAAFDCAGDPNPINQQKLENAEKVLRRMFKE